MVFSVFIYIKFKSKCNLSLTISHLSEYKANLFNSSAFSALMSGSTVLTTAYLIPVSSFYELAYSSLFALRTTVNLWPIVHLFA